MRECRENGFSFFLWSFFLFLFVFNLTGEERLEFQFLFLGNGYRFLSR